jgi:hypothetical protein
MAFTKSEENYIEHEVQLRVNEHKFKNIEESSKELKESIRHLDNKFMLMFTVILGSIWLPAILHYLHIA